MAELKRIDKGIALREIGFLICRLRLRAKIQDFFDECPISSPPPPELEKLTLAEISALSFALTRRVFTPLPVSNRKTVD